MIGCFWCERPCKRADMERRLMRLLLAFLTSVAWAHGPSAYARLNPEADAVHALNICLSAVEQKQQPAVTAFGSTVLRGQPDGKACTFAVKTGDASTLRNAVVSAIMVPPRSFAPAKTDWDPGAFLSRQTLCGGAEAANLSVLVSAGAKMAGQPQLIATVLESTKRDSRCDQDLGLQPALSEMLKR